MRWSIRFTVPLVIVLSLVAYAMTPIIDMLTMKWFVRDLDIRSRLISNTMNESLIPLIQENARIKLTKILNNAIQDERLYAIGVCNTNKNFFYKTQTFPDDISCENLLFNKDQQSIILQKSNGSLHISSFPITEETSTLGQLILVHDMSFIDKRSYDTKKYIFYFFICLTFLVSLLTILIAHISFKGLISHLRSILKGDSKKLRQSYDSYPDMLPLIKDFRSVIRNLEQDRLEKDESQLSWTPQTLRTILHEDLHGDEVIIVSNREPYIHVKKNNNIEVLFPASGLVTALEPIMRACSGTWIAHGSGSADKEVVDEHDRVNVPPDNPIYKIRRVWLSKEEEIGHYYGFSNEGLWPLCHIAHTRPTFRSGDFEQYVAVNEKFARTVYEESKTKDPVILVQDYHFSLLPKMIRALLPNATIITFWHIPWPNPESFGICPWKDLILEGMLGSDILGFHTQSHCRNFIDTVDRFLEARIDRENISISYKSKITSVRSYPISIEWPLKNSYLSKAVSECRELVCSLNMLSKSLLLGLGIDRLDYTKGILERFLAVERLFELYPQWIGKFTFIQIASPSRSSIEQYQQFEAQVKHVASTINKKFGTHNYIPICLKIEHHNPEQVFEYYRGVDICLVTSLHDGMNLVAKEFVASRDDEQGVLILSQFAGAVHELLEALIVNPYDIDQCAKAIHIGLSMSSVEQKERMRSMRGLIKEFNVFRWGGKMLIDAARMRNRKKIMERIYNDSTLI